MENSCYVCNQIKPNLIWSWRGAGVVTEQIANLSAGNRRQGSNPCLSAFSGCSVARSSRLVWDQEVAGSNPATPTTLILSDVINPQILWICGFFVFFRIKISQFISIYL